MPWGSASQEDPLRAGLRFTCQSGCTNCCQVQGFVYLSEQDLVNAARHTGMSKRAFEARYVYRTRNFLRLRKPRGSQCHFLNEQGCAIHPAKPTQCRLFPFWPELVESRKEWNLTAKHCPGIGQGPLIQIGSALETASEMRQAYPAIYEE
ncbi:MAG: YkgJ family cysteine cluster protein [Acidobacteriia bacterium]|nr:YkgJ family cysteine cluster protein [Terriglobia bacterium]